MFTRLSYILLSDKIYLLTNHIIEYLIKDKAKPTRHFNFLQNALLQKLYNFFQLLITT